jgi:hypothetical protein
MIQEELRQAVVDAGLTPDKTDLAQLSGAISTGHWVLTSAAIPDDTSPTNMTVGVSTADLWARIAQDGGGGVGAILYWKFSNIEGRNKQLDKVAWAGGIDALIGAETLQVRVRHITPAGVGTWVADKTYSVGAAVPFGLQELTIDNQVTMVPGDRLAFLFDAQNFTAASSRAFYVSHIGFKSL